MTVLYCAIRSLHPAGLAGPQCSFVLAVLIRSRVHEKEVFVHDKNTSISNGFDPLRSGVRGIMV